MKVIGQSNKIKNNHQLCVLDLNSLVCFLQLLDLSLQFEVVGTTCRHPTERDRKGNKDKMRKEGY